MTSLVTFLVLVLIISLSSPILKFEDDADQQKIGHVVCRQDPVLSIEV